MFDDVMVLRCVNGAKSTLCSKQVQYFLENLSMLVTSVYSHQNQSHNKNLFPFLSFSIRSSSTHKIKSKHIYCDPTDGFCSMNINIWRSKWQIQPNAKCLPLSECQDDDVSYLKRYTKSHKNASRRDNKTKRMAE